MSNSQEIVCPVCGREFERVKEYTDDKGRSQKKYIHKQNERGAFNIITDACDTPHNKKNETEQ